MSAVSELFLTALVSYGAPILGIALFLGATGIPIPTSLLVVAAGAFGRQGLLDIGIAAPLALACALAGDSLSFALGRWGGSVFSRRLGAMPAWGAARRAFERNSRLAVFLTRFLVTAAAIPVNLMAGASCKYLRFFLVALAGETIWIAAYGGLGYLFGSQWELVGQLLSDFGGLALGLVLLAGGTALLLGSIKRGRGKGEEGAKRNGPSLAQAGTGQEGGEE